MDSIKLKCSGCGALLTLENDRDFAYCKYCGTRIMLRQEQVIREIDEAKIREIESAERIKIKELEFKQGASRKKSILLVSCVVLCIIAISIASTYFAMNSFYSDKIATITEAYEALIKENNNGSVVSNTANANESFNTPEIVDAIDYPNEADFEKDLNAGHNLTGKTVTFVVFDFKPTSALGYNLWAGEHLNFVSAFHPNREKGDIVSVRVENVQNINGSWVISYHPVELST